VVLRVISHHIPIPGPKEPTILAAGRLARREFGLGRVGHRDLLQQRVQLVPLHGGVPARQFSICRQNYALVPIAARRSCRRRRGGVARVLSQPARAAGMGRERPLPDLPRNRGSRVPQGPGDRLDARNPTGGWRRSPLLRGGIDHLAFEVDGRDEVDDAHARCLSGGARIHFPPEEDRDVEDYYAVFAFDPDGIRVEVFCWSRADTTR
jgi:catechol 2,3-dioxygenase-like lactoylglutathione lyase family enzyme